MRHRVGVWVVIVAALATLMTVVALTAMDDDRPWFGRRDGMMSSRSFDGGDGRDGQWPGRQGSGRMMPGGMAEMMPGARVSSEYSYLAEMVAHHEEAVTAAHQLRRSDRGEMREFGEAIIASQSAQIDEMRQWLADWYPDRSASVDYDPMMRDLTDMSGARLDRIFLQDMIGHHMSAVMMSQQLLMRGVADHEQVAALAETIRDEQHVEIFTMQKWLREWYGGSWQRGMWAAGTAPAGMGRCPSRSG